MKKFLSIFICMIAFCCSGCSLFKTDKALITVNGEEITQKDFDNLFKRQNTSNVDSAKNQGLYLILKHNVVSELVIKQLINEEIQKHKIKVSDTEINKALTDAYSQMGGKEQFDKFLKNIYGISDDEFKKTLKEEISINKLIDKIAPMAGTSDSEAKSFYEKHGCTVSKMALESVDRGLLKAERRVMTTKHCLKHAFNMCGADKNLFLVDEKGKRYPLKFNCENCEMEIHY